jgi:hypothetical protein
MMIQPDHVRPLENETFLQMCNTVIDGGSTDINKVEEMKKVSLCPGELTRRRQTEVLRRSLKSERNKPTESRMVIWVEVE